jgi:hypothetical protein
MASEHGEPTEGMCCLCNMEDITKEDGNYGEYVFALTRFWLLMIAYKLLVVYNKRVLLS